MLRKNDVKKAEDKKKNRNDSVNEIKLVFSLGPLKSTETVNINKPRFLSG
ncbi:hypothetical protein SAMD00020551_2031 [Mesobacillus selenatarsenatis SF-1]|uniref:Uncharacterized protein n=1 Tax=Mesobacillus selenatarsenatis (strain DSM 18680 / JCM 14380 / FERM P-15431 / SF-1) TaxID=1321606 RepID=A0A0A8X3T2_MESS1|nr:hypothetical protein SAMD00020551_2031 [Mesobacillus selenatarsenatis SF-1]